MTDQPLPRPSSAPRWCGPCPGSVQLESRYPESASAAAENGTRLHDLGAKALMAGKVLEPCPEDDAKVLEPYVADVRAAFTAGTKLHIEHPATWALDRRLQGTPDAAVYDPQAKRLIIWDLKTGWRLVEVIENLQLICYALMLCPQGWSVELRIVQPLPYHPDGSVRSFHLSWTQLQQWAPHVAKCLKEACKPDARLSPGKHCLYCDALVGCPAAREVSLGAIEYTANQHVDLPAEHMGQELRILQDTLALLKLRTGALEEMVESKLRRGERVPGTYMKEGRGGRTKWIDAEKARVTLKMITGEDYSKPALPTPTQLKNAGVSDEMMKPLTEYHPGKMKVSTDADEQAKKVFGDTPSMEQAK